MRPLRPPKRWLFSGRGSAPYLGTNGAVVAARTGDDHVETNGPAAPLRACPAVAHPAVPVFLRRAGARPEPRRSARRKLLFRRRLQLWQPRPAHLLEQRCPPGDPKPDPDAIAAR